MHRKRDDTDPRFIAARLGGKGGFSYYAKAGTRAPYAFTTVIPRKEQAHLSIDAELAKAYTPDAIKGRARAVLALAMERVETALADRDNELRLNELAPTMAALGRISGIQTDDTKDSTIAIHIVRDTPPALPPAPTAIARLLPPDGAPDDGA
jgi:hypothetical protein